MIEANVHRTLIGKSFILKGEVTGMEAMHIEGRVEGSIALPGQTITVGRTGQTEALLIANEIVVLGQVRGNCEASDHLDIRSEGSMSGDAIVSRISIADGAFVKEKSTFAALELGDETRDSNCQIFLLSLSNDGD